MVCKNGIKEYAAIGLFCVLVTVAGAMWLDGYSLTAALWFGGATGVAVPLVLFGCACYEEHYVKKLRERVESLEMIICEGWAHKGEMDGWLFLSDEAIEFYPCNDDKEEFAMPLHDIEKVEINLYSITVYGKGDKHRFHIYRPLMWKKMICNALKA